MKNTINMLALLLVILIVNTVQAQVLSAKTSTVIDDNTIRAILNEASGENAYNHTKYLSSIARYPISKGFHKAAEYVATEARKLGLENVEIEEIASPNSIGWDPVEGELTLIAPFNIKLTDIRSIPVALCNNSNDVDIEAEIVDVGSGTKDADYNGLDVKGKIVLASASPYSVQQMAIFKYGAAGIISYASNSFFGVEPSRDSVSWMRIQLKNPAGGSGGFAFMISPDQGEKLHDDIKGSNVKYRVRAHVRVETYAPAPFEMVKAEIAGTSRSEAKDLVFSAHLDHQNPGANDNASGSAALLEIARTIKVLIKNGVIPAPKYTIRFWWVKEISGTEAYFQKHPDDAKKIALNVNIDQAGGDKHYRNDLVFIREPAWMTTLANDIFEDICEYMQAIYADVYHKPSSLFVAPTGRTDEPLTYRAWIYADLTDHIVFEQEGRNIPSISFAYPSFHYIHTSEDSIEHIDATTLKRSVFFATAIATYVVRKDVSGIDAFAERGRAILRKRLEEARAKAGTLLEQSNNENLNKLYPQAQEVLRIAYSSTQRLFSTMGNGLFSAGTLEGDLAALAKRYKEMAIKLGVKPIE